MNERPYRILFVARDDGGCGFFRCKQPAEFLKRAGLCDTQFVLNTPSNEQLFWADLVVMQEMGSVEASNLASFMRKNKIPYVAEFDDYIFHISPHNVSGYGAWNPATLFVHRSLELARGAAAITVSTNSLARELFPYNDFVYVLPNYLDKEKWDIPLTRKNDDKIRIGWAGGNAHADDLRMISKVIDKIVKEYKGKVIFETMGMTRQELAGVFPMKIQNEVCISCGYEGELHHHFGESLDNYPLVLASMGWNIAVAPVIDNGFGNAKSDLKIKEYSALGLPIVASPVASYREASEHGAYALLANTFEEWYNIIKMLIEDTAYREEIAKENKAWSEQNWIQDNAKNIFEAYRQVILRVGITGGRLQDKKVL